MFLMMFINNGDDNSMPEWRWIPLQHSVYIARLRLEGSNKEST